VGRVVGIVAEDVSDVNVAKVLARRLSRSPVGFKHFVGRGCGKIAAKCSSWAETLGRRGCTDVVVIHDLDERNEQELRARLNNALAACSVRRKAVVIPIREIEAWFLSDEKALRRALGLWRDPHRVANPQSVPRPKEFLRDLVARNSRTGLVYVNTVHNAKIAAAMSLDIVARKCPSFIPFKSFFS
jgi:uncharacterized protein DUF4276